VNTIRFATDPAATSFSISCSVCGLEGLRRHGRPIVMMHGFAGTGSSEWTHQIDGLKSGFRLIIPDLRGHSRTNNPSGRDATNYRQFAAAMAMLCERGIDRLRHSGVPVEALLLVRRPAGQWRVSTRAARPRLMLPAPSARSHSNSHPGKDTLPRLTPR
jgi:pimeloyl-ACP methyl ester carboxylesterase